jgi:hypothetical protein
MLLTCLPLHLLPHLLVVLHLVPLIKTTLQSLCPIQMRWRKKKTLWKKMMELLLHFVTAQTDLKHELPPVCAMGVSSRLLNKLDKDGKNLFCEDTMFSTLLFRKRMRLGLVKTVQLRKRTTINCSGRVLRRCCRQLCNVLRILMPTSVWLLKLWMACWLRTEFD